MTDFTPEQITEFADFLTANPDKIPESLKAKPVDTITPVTQGSNGLPIGSTVETDKKIETLQKENETLKSTLEKMTKEADKLKADIPEMLKSTLEAHDAKLKADQEYTTLSTELYSVMKESKESADKILALKPSIEMLKSIILPLKEKNQSNSKVGANAGEAIQSTVDKTDDGITVGGSVIIGR